MAVETWKRSCNKQGGFGYRVACDARAWREGDRRRETATGMAMKSASAKSLVNGRSQVRAVTCHVNDADFVAENKSSVTGRSRCWGKAAAPNDVIILSSSSSRPSCIVKFDVTERKKKEIMWRELGTEWGCSSRVLNVCEAYAFMQLEQ